MANSAPDILTLASEGNASDVLREMRVRSLYSNYYFAKVVLGFNLLTDYFHYPEMEDFLRRLEEGVNKQGIEWSRGFYKTTCFTIGTSMWLVLPVSDEDSDFAIDKLGIKEDAWFRRVSLHNQNYKQLLAFETKPNAIKKVETIKWHFEDNEMFRLLFPEIAYRGNEPIWRGDCLVIQRTGPSRQDQEGTFEAIGVKGSLQSKHYDWVWEDDLVGEKAKKSETVMNDTIGWHSRLHGAFTDATRGHRVLVSNRWGYHDLNKFIRENEKDFVWHTRSAIEVDSEGKEYAVFPVDGEGKIRYTIENLLKIRESGSMTHYDFSCQYLNSPILPGEEEVNLSKLHTYDILNDGKIVCGCGFSCYPHQLKRYLHYDPYNAKGVASKSCPAIACVGLSPDKHHHIFLLDLFYYKGSYAKVYKRLFAMNNLWRPHVFTYEDVGHQNMTEFTIREIEKTEEFRKKGNRKFPRIIPLSTEGKSFEMRVREYLIPRLESCTFSRRMIHHAFDSQLESFPNPVLNHDYDILDALSQGGRVWRFPLASEVDMEDYQLNKEEREVKEYESALGLPYSSLSQEFYPAEASKEVPA